MKKVNLENNLDVQSSSVVSAVAASSSTTSESTSPTLYNLRNLLRMKRNNVRNLSPDEIVQFIEKLYARKKYQNCLRMCR
jgi:hypothetical protein